MLPIGRDGAVKAQDVAALVASRSFAGPAVIALQLANNETGVIQPVAAIAELAHAQGIRMHTDAVQAAGRMPIDFAALGVDTLAISAHKFGGPKGVGALVVRDHLDLMPLIRGGGQERRRRAGTENVAGDCRIWSRSRSCASRSGDDRSASEFCGIALETEIRRHQSACDHRRRRRAATCEYDGGGASRQARRDVVIRLDLAGIAVSAGSACSSGKVGASHVLEAMGLGHEMASSTIRISLGPTTTKDDIAAFLAAWKTIAGEPALAA